SKGCREQPALLHPLRLKIWSNALQMWQKLLQDFFFAHLEQGIIHRTIVAQIDEVPSTIFVSRTEIRMLKQTCEGITGIADIDPVAIGQLTIQSQNETLRPICLPPLIFSPIILR